MMSVEPLRLADAFKHVCCLIDDSIVNIDPDSTTGGWQSLTRPLIPQFPIDRLQHIQRGGKSISVLRFIHALMTFSYSRSSVGFDLWNRLVTESGGGVERLVCIEGGQGEVGRWSRIAPEDGETWQSIAGRITGSMEMKSSLRMFAIEWFEFLFVPYMAEGGTPEPGSISTAARNQRELREKLFRRDGYLSPVGYILDINTPQGFVPLATENIRSSKLEAAHVIPFCTSARTRMRELLEVFGGGDLATKDFIGQNINAANNALLLAEHHHTAFGSFLFAIEALAEGLAIRYRIRFFVPAYKLPPGTEMYQDKDEIQFGGGPDNTIDKPSPILLNIHSALAKVLHASRTAEVIQAVLREEEDMKAGATTGSEWGTTGVFYLNRKLSNIASE